MSNAKTELFIFMAAAFATLIGLLVLQKAYGSFIDVSYHRQLQEGGPSQALEEARQAEQAQLQKGKIPVEQAIGLLAKGRSNIGSIAPQPSEDLSAISGWIHHPDFKPVVAHPIRVARAPMAAAPKATEPPAAEPEAEDAAAEPAGAVEDEEADPTDDQPAAQSAKAAKGAAKAARPTKPAQPAQPAKAN